MYFLQKITSNLTPVWLKWLVEKPKQIWAAERGDDQLQVLKSIEHILKFLMN